MSMSSETDHAFNRAPSFAPTNQGFNTPSSESRSLNVMNTNTTEQASSVQQNNLAAAEQSHEEPQLTKNEEEDNKEIARTSRCGIVLITLGFQLPLATAFSFGNELFLDGSLPSLALLCGFCVMNTIQIFFTVRKKSITDYEIIVYSLLLICALALNSYTYYQQLVVGMNKLNIFVLNVAALSASGTNVIYDMLRECRRFDKRKKELSLI
jgi:hypothetical protein